MTNGIILTYFKVVWVVTGTHRQGNDTCNTINIGAIAWGGYKRLPRPVGCTTNSIEIQLGCDMCKATTTSSTNEGPFYKKIHHEHTK